MINPIQDEYYRVSDNWWEPYMPKLQETYQDYLRRAQGFDRDFVMMKHKPNDLDIIGRAHQLMATRHTFVPGSYVCFVLGPIVTLFYTEEYSNGSW
jgi:hypothetical protein